MTLHRSKISIESIKEKDFFRAAPCFISVQGPDLKIISVNDNFQRTFGDAVDRYCYSVYKRRDNKCSDCPVEQTFRDADSHMSEQLVILPSGQEIPIMAYTSPVRGDDGQIIAVVEISADITQVKELEHKLWQSRERFRLLFEESPCYISVQDRDFNIVNANRNFKEDFGDKLGSPCYKIYKHREEECLRCPVAETFHDGQGHSSEEVVTSLAGERINTLVSTAPLYNQQGELDRVMEMSANITQIRDLQGQLTNLGLLIGSMSHGLKGLITGLDGGAYLLNTGLEKGKKERIDKGWRMIQRNIEHIRRVVLDLLYLSGKEEPNFEPYNLYDLAYSVTRSFLKRADDLRIHYVIDLDKTVGICEVDVNAIKGSIRNILDYCFEACRLDNKKAELFVSISLSSDKDNSIIDIKDNGVGMDRESREKMFSPFFSSKGTGGTSLGLFTANKVIEKHRGVIEVKSESGEGSSFHIRIPKVRSGVTDYPQKQ